MALFHSEKRRHIMIIGDMLLIQPFRESYFAHMGILDKDKVKYLLFLFFTSHKHVHTHVFI